MLLAGLLFFLAAALFLGALALGRVPRKAHAEALAQIAALQPAAAKAGQAEAASEAKSRFLANVSHEIRTPLAGIVGMADLLAATPVNGEQQSYIDAIHSCGAALGEMIEGVLDFSRIEANRLDLEKGLVDLVALVEGVVELLAPRAQTKNLEIAAHLEADVPTVIAGDAVRLRQILLNLIGNAIKFTEAGGVSIYVRISGNELVFTVQDTGSGVPLHRQQAIFEEFEQADGSATQSRGGSGLGLTIARRLSHLMSGRLELVSSGPGGTTFEFGLPLPADRQVEPSPPSQVGHLAGKTAIIIADTRFEAPYLAASLRGAGLAAETIDGTQAALQRLMRQPLPVLVIIDCSFGREQVRAVVDMAKRVGVAQRLMLFSPMQRRIFGETLLTSGDGWLVKPVRQHSLLARLQGGEAPAAPASSTTQIVGSGAGLAVLLAEDNEINALVARRHLEALGASVHVATDGLAALALVRRALLGETGRIDLVLLDLRMPGMGGMDVARELRRIEAGLGCPPLRLVVLTANGDEATRQLCQMAGFDDFLVKPVDRAVLADLLAGLRQAEPQDTAARLNRAC